MKRWRVDGDPPEAVLDELAEVLKRGGVALLPTDTIYGLHAVASDQTAIARIKQMKGRGDDKPFVIIASSIDQLIALGATVPAELAEVWPAPLTAVLASGETTIAARIPDLAWLRSLLGRTGPLVSTSANRSGEPPVTSPERLANDLIEGLDALLDQGLREGKPSTIVDFTGTSPRLVREGDPRFSQFLRKTLWKGL
ncbi:MAG: L-threonylcarbamoyladenylate synthase [Thermoanaerobaculia bacterium]|jgi:tRNA threonylcarbamoyl adenosine modification protein (Sua5/YciO/YrdC/YwlC family)|nr:L-threonylcarbamoyladenylate synthase [Thermoanaerobaculia bacterium]